jgi:Ca2+-binding RTX toxin-like protein
LSEDAWQGDAQYQILVDGKQIGGTYAATADHRVGAWQDVTLTAASANPQKVEVKFLNDAWGGTDSTDRNLYLDYIEVNGRRYEGEAAASNTAAAGYESKDPHAAVFAIAGSVIFDTSAAAPAASLAQTSALTALSAPNTAAPADAPAISALDAAPTPEVARTSVAPNGLTANGTSGADDLYATGAGQTLNGNGGNDIFHIGTYTDAKIVVGTTGITEVSTWASKYTLADGVGNLRAEGDYAHNLTGNAGHNWIVGGNANDTLNGGAGNDMLQVGTGANDLAGGSGKDMFVFADKADHDNVIHDFTLGADMIDLSGALKSAGYTGSNAVTDRYVSLVQAGADGTTIMIDPDGNGAGAAHKLVTIEHVLPSALKMGADVVWH